MQFVHFMDRIQEQIIKDNFSLGQKGVLYPVSSVLRLFPRKRGQSRIPVGELKAGSNLSAVSLAFSRKRASPVKR